MDVKMNRNMGRVLLATACAAALTVGTAVPAFAAAPGGNGKRRAAKVASTASEAREASLAARSASSTG